MPGIITKWQKVTSITLNSLGTLGRAEIKGALPTRHFRLFFKGTVDVAAGGGADGTAVVDRPFSYLTRIFLQENGGRILYSTDGGANADINQVMHRTRPQGSGISTGAATGKAFNAHYIIPFSMPRKFSVGQDDTLYDARGKILGLECTPSSGADGGFAHSDSTRTFSNLLSSVTVEAEVVQETQAPSNPLKLALVSTHNTFRDSNIATSSRFQRKLNNSAVIRYLILKMLVSPASGNTSFDPDPSDAVLNNISLESARLGPLYQAQREHLIGVDKLRYAEESFRNGVYPLDLTGESHQYTDGLDTVGIGDLSMFYDVTKATNQTDVQTIFNEIYAIA